MKLLHVISSMDPAFGGVSQAVRTMIKGLSSFGISSEVASMDNPSVQAFQQDDFPVHKLGPAKTGWYYSAHLSSWLNKNLTQFDVVIVHGLWLYHGFAVRKALQKIKSNRPVFCVMPHGMLDPYFQKARTRKLKAIRNRFFWQIFEKKLINQADTLLFTCDTEKLLARETFPSYAPKKEDVIGLGVEDAPGFANDMNRHFYKVCEGLEMGKAYFLFLGRVDEKKGVDILVNAYKDLARTDPDLPSLVIAGPGMETPYGQMIRSLSAGEKIFFPGMLRGDQKWGAFYNCETFILPSHQENFGIAVVEAMACKKPVLISDQVNIWREIINGEAGIVAKDSEDAVLKQLRDWRKIGPEEKRQMGQNARAAYKKYFSIEEAANRAKNVFEAYSQTQ